MENKEEIRNKKMENKEEIRKWKFQGNNESLTSASNKTVRGVLTKIIENINPNDGRQLVFLGSGDPSQAPSFRPCLEAVDAIVDSLRSSQFNCYSSTVGILPARKAVAEYLSRDLPYKLSADDVFITLGCTQAIEVALAALSRPGANILLPRPGFPFYEARCEYIGLEYRHFDLLPDKGWEIDLDSVEALADENTVAIVVINPGNPCGCIYTYDHLKKVAEVAKKLGILVIADEVYDHLTFGNNPFVPMGVFGRIVPVLTLGSISKRMIVPGWRLGWLATTDTQGTMLKYGLVDSFKGFLNISSDPVTFIQAAMPQIIEKTTDEFFSKIIKILRHNADLCYEKLTKIPSITCPHKPEGSMFLMAKLDISLLNGIQDDVDFCIQLAKEENVIILPGSAVSLKNWLHISFALETPELEQGLERIETFCKRREILMP